MELFFSFRDSYFGGFCKDFPGFIVVDLLFAGINGLGDFKVMIFQELLGFFTRGSTFTQVGPIDQHDLLSLKDV